MFFIDGSQPSKDYFGVMWRDLRITDVTDYLKCEQKTPKCVGKMLFYRDLKFGIYESDGCTYICLQQSETKQK